jgi:hypothetical protein
MLNDNVIPLPQSGQPISVLNVRPSPKPGATRAYADLQYYGAMIYGLSVVRHKNGSGHFVGFPVRFGSKKSFPIVEFAEPDRGRIARLVLDAAKPYLD